MWLYALVLGAHAEDAQLWFQLQQARYLMMETEELESSIDILNGIIAQSEPDDFIVAQAEYWKGRALYDLGFSEHAEERLTVASNDYELRSSSLYFLEHSAAWEKRVDDCHTVESMGEFRWEVQFDVFITLGVCLGQ